MQIRHEVLHHYEHKTFRMAVKDITAYQYFNDHDRTCEIYIKHTPFGHRKLQILNYPSLEGGKFRNAMEKMGYNIKLAWLKFLTFLHITTRDESGQKQLDLYNKRVGELNDYLVNKTYVLRIAGIQLNDQLEMEAKPIHKPPRAPLDYYTES